MPARLRYFVPADWGTTEDASDDDLREAQSRFNRAWLAWCRVHAVSPLDVLLERQRLRVLDFPPPDHQ